jgi:hypothetical protein
MMLHRPGWDYLRPGFFLLEKPQAAIQSAAVE